MCFKEYRDTLDTMFFFSKFDGCTSLFPETSIVVQLLKHALLALQHEV